jgi:hypothetical protein
MAKANRDHPKKPHKQEEDISARCELDNESNLMIKSVSMKAKKNKNRKSRNKKRYTGPDLSEKKRNM